MRKSALLILIIMAFFFSACQTTPISTIDINTPTNQVKDSKPTVTVLPTEEATPTVSSTVDPTATAVVEEKVVENTSTPEILPTTPTPQIISNPTATAVIIIPVEETEQPTEQTTEQPTSVPNSTEISTPSPPPTPEPTKAPEYTVISSQIRSGALEGVNEAREEEGHSPASLSSSLNVKAESHAIEMAKANCLYHSSMGYDESIRSGAFIGGWAEGYGAANHATQLCLDADVVNIGVGCAKSADGTVYTCIIGSN